MHMEFAQLQRMLFAEQRKNIEMQNSMRGNCFVVCMHACMHCTLNTMLVHIHTCMHAFVHAQTWWIICKIFSSKMQKVWDNWRQNVRSSMQDVYHKKYKRPWIVGSVHVNTEIVATNYRRNNQSDVMKPNVSWRQSSSRNWMFGKLVCQCQRQNAHVAQSHAK